MNLFSYIVVNDSGFAPNPFHGICTLACCKPDIRRVAKAGDLIVGLSPKSDGNRLVYVMRVGDQMSFADYWHHRDFRRKRPRHANDCGDNIYMPLATGGFRQLPSAHSNGEVEDAKSKARDLGGRQVLLSDDFVYFGGEARNLPPQFARLIVGRAHKRFRSPDHVGLIEAFEKFFASLPRGIRGRPRERAGDTDRQAASRCKKKAKR